MMRIGIPKRWLAVVAALATGAAWAQEAATPEAPAPEAAKVDEAKVEAPAPAPEPAAEEPSSWLEELPMKIGVFSDVGGTITDSGAPPGFFLGQFDIFITGGYGKWRLLTEVVVEEAHGSATGVGVDVERVQVRYAHRDWLNVTVGRLHQRLGYYNATFHHGAFLQTTANRPTIIGFEDEAGFLPVHLVGLEVDGRVSLGDVALTYVLGLGNGRSTDMMEILQHGDNNLAKGAAVQLGAEYEPWGLSAGVGFLYDRISGFTPASTGVPVAGLDEFIASAFAVLDLEGALVIAEAYGIRHAGEGRQWQTLGGFLEGSYAFDWVRPYLRLEGLATDTGSRDPYFEGLLMNGNQLTTTLGVKFEVNRNVVVRVEAERTDRALGRPVHTGTVQFAIAL